MEIEGRIINVLPKQEGTSARTGNHWASQEYVIETHDQYPKKCCFRVFGEDRIAAMNIQAGEELRVSFDIDAREYQGRWFNSVNAWKIDRIDPAAAQAAQPGMQPAPPISFGAPQPEAPFGEQPAAQASESAPADDLPF
ncbi:MAG: DUF3127 domain-containing protein [Prevotella sp.]|uniref:DUF3127 domain-containing protein n=1 Tax=Prevotella sp. TaxID=59823 RepID=UPI002A2E5D76|nr:DUF3127 domain-containing protein [Prevotella sp.]MDD7318533.1 DUF3127 domain-containing protein [Prevotellaceae bacterium]MDY4020334.1 DUF3127 domain-containing protein [Prevotella sp.]